MKLEGQGALGESKLTRESLDERGYIMVVLLIGMGAAAIWMAAALPAWRQQAIREKEADLVFRGEQYARAIALYYAKNNNTLPPSIDILVSGKYLRKKWKDPVTGLDFTPVGSALPGQGGSQPGGANPLGGRGPVGGNPTGGSPSGGLGNAPGSGTVPPRGSGPVQGGPSGSPPGRPGGPGVGGPGQQGMQTGISGVRSQSQATSIRLYQGQQIYAAWPFDYAQMMPRIFGAPAGAAPAGGRPGGPGGGRGPNTPGVGQPGRGPGGPVGPGGPSGPPGGRGPGGRIGGGSS